MGVKEARGVERHPVEPGESAPREQQREDHHARRAVSDILGRDILEQQGRQHVSPSVRGHWPRWNVLLVMKMTMTN